MFDAKRAIEKLDAIWNKSIIPSPCLIHIREILQAGQTDDQDKKYLQERRKKRQSRIERERCIVYPE